MQELILKDGTIKLSGELSQKVKAHFKNLSETPVIDVLQYLSTLK